MQRAYLWLLLSSLTCHQFLYPLDVSMSNIQAIVLAAGKGSRFKTGISKLLEPLCGQAMVLYIMKHLQALHIPTTVIVGYQKEHVIEQIMRIAPEHVQFIEQTEQRGTGHAVMCSQPGWYADHLLIINGDVPLIPPSLLETLCSQHLQSNATVSLVVSYLANPAGAEYGRVVQNVNGTVAIVEHRDFTGDKTAPCFINAGIYLMKRSFVEEAIRTLHASTVTAELYLTELIEKASATGHTVTLVETPFDDIRGVNTLHELWTAEKILRARMLEYWMNNGVRFTMPETVHLDSTVTIGAGTHIGAGVHLTGSTRIGTHCTIEPYSIIHNSTLDDYSTVLSHSVIDTAHLAAHAQVGPFAHVHQSSVAAETVIGNFVEIKRSSIGNDTRIKHLSYVGDAQVGNAVNVGAGTITCNYDGHRKHTTVIEDQASIGSLNALIAPVVIGTRSITGAGSVITQNVPADALAIARASQINKEGYALKYRAKIKGKVTPASSEV